MLAASVTRPSCQTPAANCVDRLSYQPQFHSMPDPESSQGSQSSQSSNLQTPEDSPREPSRSLKRKRPVEDIERRQRRQRPSRPDCGEPGSINEILRQLRLLNLYVGPLQWSEMQLDLLGCSFAAPEALVLRAGSSAQRSADEAEVKQLGGLFREEALALLLNQDLEGSRIKSTCALLEMRNLHPCK